MPKGGTTSLVPVCAGLREDLDLFLRAFLKLGAQRFSDYKSLFEIRGMIHLFSGRSNSAEVVEFHETILIYCLRYMQENVCEGVYRCLEERLFGLYSLYTFFYLQSADHVVKVRMDPDSARSFVIFGKFLLKEEIYDAHMCIQQLQRDKAFKIVAFIKTHDPSCYRRLRVDQCHENVKLVANVNDPLGNVKCSVNSVSFQQLSAVHRQYTKLKVDHGLHLFGESGLSDLHTEAKRIVTKCMMDTEKGEISTSCKLQTSNRTLTRSEIKEKAYRSSLNLSRSRRHRTVSPILMPAEFFNFREIDENELVEEEKEKSEPEENNEVEEDTKVKFLKRRKKNTKRGPGRPRKNPEEKKPPAKRQKLESTEKPSTLKTISGRKTNNSIATKLFCTDIEPDEPEMDESDEDVHPVPLETSNLQDHENFEKRMWNDLPDTQDRKQVNDITIPEIINIEEVEYSESGSSNHNEDVVKYSESVDVDEVQKNAEKNENAQRETADDHTETVPVKKMISEQLDTHSEMYTDFVKVLRENDPGLILKTDQDGQNEMKKVNNFDSPHNEKQIDKDSELTVDFVTSTSESKNRDDTKKHVSLVGDVLENVLENSNSDSTSLMLSESDEGEDPESVKIPETIDNLDESDSDASLSISIRDEDED